MMLVMIAAVWSAASAAMYEIQTIPFQHEDASFFVADCDGDDIGDILVVDGDTLVLCPSTKNRTMQNIQISPDTTAFDIADIDGDKQPEIIAVCGDRIVRQNIRLDGQASPPQELFRLETLFLDAPATTAKPYVLVADYSRGTLLALPREDALELRNTDGTLVQRLAFESAPKETAFFGSFTYWYGLDPFIGAPNAFEMRVVQHIECVPRLGPAIERPYEQGDPYARALSLAWRVCGNSNRRYEEPFKIAGDASASKWAFCVRDSDTDSVNRRQATVWILDLRLKNAAADEWDETAGPPRRYPGYAPRMLDQDTPDFNGDGYNDLLLLSTPSPGLSVGSITQAVAGRTWPLNLAVYLFAPDKNRFQPKPQGALELKMPVDWFFHGGELQNGLLRDLDADGKTDLACSTEENRFSVWLYKDGFADTPDFDYRFPKPLQRILLEQDLDGKRRMTLLLKSEDAFYALYPKP